MVFPSRSDVIAALQIHTPRRQSTKNAYQRRFNWLRARFGAHGDLATVARVIEGFAALAPTLRSNSLRQYRAAILHGLREAVENGYPMQNTVPFLRQLGLLDGRRLERNTAVGPARCGHGARKSMTRKARQTVGALNGSVSPRQQNLWIMLIFGPSLGLRPWEWPTAHIRGTTLHIPSAKVSPALGRGLAAERLIDISLFPSQFRLALSGVLDRLKLEMQGPDDSAKVMLRYARLLRRVREDPRLTLRTVRHQFRANMRADGWQPEEIAVAMNHTTTKSQAGYGKAAKPSKPRFKIGIDRSLVSSVRQPGLSTALQQRLTVSNRSSLTYPAPPM